MLVELHGAKSVVSLNAPAGVPPEVDVIMWHGRLYVCDQSAGRGHWREAVVLDGAGLLQPPQGEAHGEATYPPAV